MSSTFAPDSAGPLLEGGKPSFVQDDVSWSSGDRFPASSPDPAPEQASGLLRSGDIAALDRETCDRLEITSSQSEAILTYLCQKMALVLWRERRLDVQGFGTFRIRDFRPADTGPLDFSVVECPYVGPVEFTASALLIRQLETRQDDPTLVARCDQLYAALRDDGQLTRGRIPLLLKGAFQAFTLGLINRHQVLLPSFGTLYVRTGPPSVRFDQQDKVVRSSPARLSVALRIHRPLLERFPWRQHKATLPVSHQEETSLPRDDDLPSEF